MQDHQHNRQPPPPFYPYRQNISSHIYMKQLPPYLLMQGGPQSRAIFRLGYLCPDLRRRYSDNSENSHLPQPPIISATVHLHIIVHISLIEIYKPLSRTNGNYFIFASPKLSRRVESCQSISSPKLVSMPNQLFLRNRSLVPIMRSCEDDMYHLTLFFYLAQGMVETLYLAPFSANPLSFWLPFM